MAMAVTTAAVAGLSVPLAVAQDYTPVEEFHDLSDMPETGMYPQGGSKPGEGQTAGGPPPQPQVAPQEVTVGPGHLYRDLPTVRRLRLAAR